MTSVYLLRLSLSLPLCFSPVVFLLSAVFTRQIQFLARTSGPFSRAECNFHDAASVELFIFQSASRRISIRANFPPRSPWNVRIQTKRDENKVETEDTEVPSAVRLVHVRANKRDRKADWLADTPGRDEGRKEESRERGNRSQVFRVTSFRASTLSGFFL